MPPRTIKFKDKKSGKVYDMPWDKDSNPTPYDLAKFSYDADNPDWHDQSKKSSWSGLG